MSCFPQQWRLLPYLAAAYALDHFSKTLFLDLIRFYGFLLKGERSARQVRHLLYCCWGRAALFQQWDQTKAAGCGSRACVNSFSCPTILGFGLPSDLQFGLCPSPHILGMCWQSRTHSFFESTMVFTLRLSQLLSFYKQPHRGLNPLSLSCQPGIYDMHLHWASSCAQ